MNRPTAPASVAGASVAATPPRLQLSVGQYSDKGRKADNQDACAARIPPEPQLSLKGAAVAIADGISSSPVSQIASASAVQSFLDDYFCTSEAWSVRTAAERVIAASNSWLVSQTRRSEYRYDADRGYVCTFSALVIKAATAHLFHVGDARIYRLQAGEMEQLTKDHRLRISREENYLSRALGVEEPLEIDYRALPLRAGDVFLLATDGVYEYLDEATVRAALSDADDLNDSARRLATIALERGSDDNLSVQLLRVDALPNPDARDLHLLAEALPLPPVLESGDVLDGYRIEREIHATSRSHVFLVVDTDSGDKYVMKTPSIDLAEDPEYLERFLLEEWIARRIHSPHVLSVPPVRRPRSCLYTLSDYIEGRTLTQWLRDNPGPDLETVRDIIEQAAKGLRAFHRLEMLHQDLKPDNLMIDAAGTVKIIDVGATRVAGIVESQLTPHQPELLGTALYAAPEYFLGEGGSPASDLYSLGVIAYQLLSGRFPYGPTVARAKSLNAQRRLRYLSVRDEDSELPAWLDDTLKKAVHPDPVKRYQELSEFLYDLRHPNQQFLNKTRPPLIERKPVQFWQGVSALLLAFVVYLLSQWPNSP